MKASHAPRGALAVALLMAGSVLLGCREDERAAGRRAQVASLGGDVVARVGSSTVSRALVAEVAAAEGISPREAAQRLVDDAVAAEAARERGIDTAWPARWALVAARARIITDRYRAEAVSAGAPTDEEMAAVAKRHWREVDRPPSVRVVHALVKRPADAALVDEARAAARALKARVLGATSAADFEARARSASLPHGMDLVVESLPAFTEDGFIVDGPGTMDENFSRAAFAIDAPGHASGIVDTSFGLHVIHLLERLPEQRMPIESRRVAFADEVNAARARARVEEALAAQKAKRPVEVLPFAEATMREAHVERRP